MDFPPEESYAEKYRPEVLTDIVDQPGHEIAKQINGRRTPNFLFHGPSGTGKTSAALCIAREIHGNEDHFVKINASRESGVDMVKDRVKKVGRQLTVTGKPPVLFLDEMGRLSPDAQQALRVPLEEYPAVFLLSTNYPDKVIDPLKSRCDVREFGPIADTAIYERLQEVAAKEQVDIGDDQLRSIAHDADGDLRKALTNLQKYVDVNEVQTGVESWSFG